jgi:tRNA dimethylallyltransferase
MKNNNIYAIVGPTASGKSDLALKLAKKDNAIILSVDSLSVYKEIDIASAKPSKEELAQAKHFGVNLLNPDEKFDVVKFLDEFNRAKTYAKRHNKSLIIVGGTGFYLKVLTQGISPMPQISQDIKLNTAKLMQNLELAFSNLQKIDPAFASQISPSDRYRIEKAYQIYLSTNIAPSEYFKANPPKPLEPNLPIYEIKTIRDELRERITKRTQIMLDMGLINEVAKLEYKYTRAPNSMKSIGIKEVLEYFDGKLNKAKLKSKIITNTAQLAKRQVTFNKSQLNIAFRGSVEDIYSYIIG